MKKLLYIFLCSLPVFCVAQDVVIPDANFLAALIEEGVDTNGDGVIQVSEAEVVVELDVSKNEISDLTGIEQFVNLEILDCSQNNLTVIQVSSLTNLKELDCVKNELITLDFSNNSQLATLECTGNELQNLIVSNNLELKRLDCTRNQLTEIDVSNNLHLQVFECSQNQLSVLDVTNNLELSFLNCDFNSLTSLDLSGNIVITTLSCHSNQLNSLDISSNLELSFLNCGSNNLTELNLSSNLLISTLSCHSNQLTNLDVSNNILLVSFSCGYNNLTEINLSNNTLLEYLHINENDISNLDLSNNPLLYFIDFGFNNITEINLLENPLLEEVICIRNLLEEIDLTNLIVLTRLECAANKLKSIDLSSNVLLNYVDCRGNELNTLDLSNNELLQHISCNQNDIYFLNIANGSILECIYSLSCEIQNDSLRYICIDENEYQWLEEQLGDFINQVSVNTYCNFSLNNGLNALTGKNQYEPNGNCNDNSITATYVPFAIQDNSQYYKFWPAYDTTSYNMFFPSGPHVIKHCLDPDLFVSAPDSIDIDFLGVSDTIYQDWCINPLAPIVSDVAITILPLNITRAGFNTSYKIIIDNVGNTYSSGNVSFSFPMDSVQVISSSETYSSNENVITWEYEDLPILSKKIFYVSTRNNSPMDTPPLVGGEVLKFSAEVIPDVLDVNQIDNATSICQQVVNSYDPNDKRCLQGNILEESMVGTYLDYMIRFENTGTAAAVNITVKDTLDANVYDIASFRLTDSSHPVYVSQQGNVIEFIFNNIYLPFQDSLNDGYVAFKIRTSDQLVLGDSISNKAYIYFDFNWPIITNDALTTVGNIDLDNDGFNNFEDCDDMNASINPDQTEIIYNGIDDDCDPLTPDDDIDQDGFPLATDCNDNDASINPDVDEIVYNGTDDDCDASTLDDDLDQDGYAFIDDCDDDNPAINPEAIEIPNNDIDENCDGTIVGVDDLDALGISIFPNPVSDILHVTQEESRSLQIELYDVQGRRVVNTVITQLHNNLDLSDIISGVYFVKLSSEEQVVYYKVVVR